MSWIWLAAIHCAHVLAILSLMDAVRVDVFWRSGFGGRPKGRGWDFFRFYTFKIYLNLGFSNVAYRTFKKINL